MRRILLIGPGGVGKSSVGRRLAQRLGYDFVDLDDVFCARIANVGAFIRAEGYARYIERNADLFQALLHENPEHVVMALSSGLLSHDGGPEIAERNGRLVETSGLSILLLPSRDVETSADIVVARQLGRGFGLSVDREAKKFRRRFAEYAPLGALQFFSTAPPEEIAIRIAEKLRTGDAEHERHPD